MASPTHWADGYIERRTTAARALAQVRPGQRVFVGSSCGEPQHLIRALANDYGRLADIEIVRLLSIEQDPKAGKDDKKALLNANIRSIYAGSGTAGLLAKQRAYHTPLNLSAVPRLFRSRLLPVNVALVQVAPPDDFGWLSLGVSVDITLAAALSADLVIAQVNSQMPRTMGRSFIHVQDVHFFVEHDEPLLNLPTPERHDATTAIGRLVGRLIDDGATLHLSPGVADSALLEALSDRRDLGIHTHFLTDGIMRLVQNGTVTNRRKTLDEGKLVVSSAIGSDNLYHFIDDNPSIEFHPSDYVNNPAVIAQHHRMTSLEVAMCISLTGQVAADALSYNNFCGVTGMVDFLRGASQADEGKAIIVMPSTRSQGTESRIVPTLGRIPAVVPRSDVHYVVTEYGSVNLFGKNLQERALAMISIAHPDFRETLFRQAKESGLLEAGSTLKESIQGVYPAHLEENVTIDGQHVTIRPAKPVDRRRIQEHFYGLARKDVVSRFMYDKRQFRHDEVEDLSQIDYVQTFTIVALVGEFGFGKVIALGEYQRVPSRNIAEVAFSVMQEWQGHGLGRRLIFKLTEAARENGLEGLAAYTSPDNRPMIRLFQSLPFAVKTELDEDVLVLSCRFSKPI